MKLRGNCPAKVDEKGRLKIPAVFLEELKEYGNQFYITSTTGVLRETAQTKGDVDVLGNLDYLEVLNHTRVLDQLKNEPYSDEDDKALEDLGI